MADGKIYVATTSVVTTVDGQNRSIHRGQTAREGHPILASHGHLFVPLVPDFEVESKPAEKAAVTPPSPRALGRKSVSAGKAATGGE